MLGALTMTLNKSQIISAIAKSNKLPKRQASQTVETLLEIIKSSLEFGDDVMITGFGKFQVKEKSERKGRNPATGEDMVLEPRKVVTFNCSGKLRERVND